MMAPPMRASWADKLLVGLVALETGDRRQLFQRIDHVVVLDAAHHRHHHPTPSPGERNQGRLVANATGRILVDLRLRNVGQVNHLARKHHLFRQICRLLRGHAGEVDRHRQRRELVLGHFAIQGAVDDVANLLLGELAAVALLLNQKSEARLDEATRRDVSFASHE
jgi:hypothetical protein